MRPYLVFVFSCLKPSLALLFNHSGAELVDTVLRKYDFVLKVLQHSGAQQAFQC